jgi:hypothetical protein
MARRRTAGPRITLFSFQDIITSVTGIMVLVTLLMSLELIERRRHAPAVQVSTSHVPDMRTAVADAQDEIRRLNDRRTRGEKLLAELVDVAPGELAEQAGDLERLVLLLERDATNLQEKEKKALGREQQAQAQAQAREPDRQKVPELAERSQQLASALERLKSENRVLYHPATGAPKAPWLVEVTAERLAAAPVGRPAQPQIFDRPTRLADFKHWVITLDRNSDYLVLLIKPSGVTIFDQLNEDLKRLGFDLGFDLLSADQTAIDPQAGAGLP